MKTVTLRPPRLLIPEDPDLPPEFFVFVADDIFEACEIAEEAFYDSSITLAIWSNAADLVPDDLKQTVHTLSSGLHCEYSVVRSNMLPGWGHFFRSNDDFTEDKIKRHFLQVAEIAQTDIHVLAAWQQDCLHNVDTLEGMLDLKKLEFSTRFQQAAHDYDGVHTDIGLRSNSLRILRVVDGDTTLFYPERDVARHLNVRGFRRVFLKENAQPWTVRPWDFAFVSQRAVHQLPSPACGYTGDNRRIVEVYNIHSCNEFINCADRPGLKRFFPRPHFV